jgi:hypothetical protein
LQHERASYAVYANAQSRINSRVNFLYLKQQKARLLAIISIFGGGDDSILWLSFAQQN